MDDISKDCHILPGESNEQTERIGSFGIYVTEPTIGEGCEDVAATNFHFVDQPVSPKLLLYQATQSLKSIRSFLYKIGQRRIIRHSRSKLQPLAEETEEAFQETFDQALQAAKQSGVSPHRVVTCDEIGPGMTRQSSRAIAFYRKAALLGDTAAMYKLGVIFLYGLLGEMKDPQEAINWLKRAAEQADRENPHALHELGLLYESPNLQLVGHNPAHAKALIMQAAHLGYTKSQHKIGQCFEYGDLTCPVDPRRSIAWYTKAAQKGDPEAELALSGWYLTGCEGLLKQSDSKAYLWARRAANKGLSKAEYAVGYYAEVGIGIKQDIDFAERWYKRAAAQGNKRAMNRLKEIKQMRSQRGRSWRLTHQEAKDECVIC